MVGNKYYLKYRDMSFSTTWYKVLSAHALSFFTGKFYPQSNTYRAPCFCIQTMLSDIRAGQKILKQQTAPKQRPSVRRVITVPFHCISSKMMMMSKILLNNLLLLLSMFLTEFLIAIETRGFICKRKHWKLLWTLNYCLQCKQFPLYHVCRVITQIG